ncbi:MULTISPECIES: DUF3829 domain-containing protein [Pseudomonas]|uniref:DUF3829 domain-containing protein n=2 Tax=Pseudomonas chlororaphis TaxID=587753 RepID=A0AAQ0ARC4_9PSED|nr:MULTISPECIES: DUF3829 domain-containing protein [Pseudomonas]AIC18968.1 hypothetical protein EY04_08665 [Pseudomonas chlororaphis]AUG40023.1 DUF3829 domain-containing protein [Pseudomonas chlororaphis]AZD97753.1 hypothetical protein C4K12_1876 [Pseudomonas chlororaphis subsp. aureofaciens]AZE03990.1 hypothetical protein C4K11_1817 [Pseudomonas chlororaphis subsp. aureofaciens]AZE22295.1 hypothetical protein C4K08_1857 [Pseudomonas chlororaphis subsp. aureofaciens]
MNTRMFLAAALLGGSVLLAGCGDKTEKVSQPAAQVDAKQQEIDKYNQYVGAANSISESFQTFLQRYQQYEVPALAGKAPISAFSVGNDILIDRLSQALDGALAIDTPIPEVDQAAQAFSAALKTLSPLSHELQNYATSKGYLSDNGELARRQSQAYLAALTAVSEKEQDFYAGLGARDLALTKQAFDEAPKDTAAYYRAGLIYYGKLNTADAETLFAEPNDPQALAAFEKSLALVADAAAGWNGKVSAQAAQSGKSCGGGMLEINEFIGQSRSIIRDVKDGVYKRAPEGAMKNLPAHMQSSSIVRSANRYNRTYGNMINRFNHPTC